MLVIMKKKITEGIKKITEDDFRKKLVGMKNPYGDGESSLRISKSFRECLYK